MFGKLSKEQSSQGTMIGSHFESTKTNCSVSTRQCVLAVLAVIYNRFGQFRNFSLDNELPNTGYLNGQATPAGCRVALYIGHRNYGSTRKENSTPYDNHKLCFYACQT